MPTKPLKKDATLNDVVDTLLQPEDHVRRVLSTLSACRMAHGNASVRIGITGQGKIPAHKVVYADDSGKEVMFGAYDQDRPFTDVAIHEDTWSTKTMTFTEVQALLGQMRGFKKA